jgi:hypothetical protein
MAIATASPISITQIIPYSLLEGGEQPTFGNRSVEKILLSAKEALQQARPDNISLVIAIAPGQKLVNEPWTRRYKPDSITFYTFFNKDNTFAAIEAISDTLAEIYGQTKILPLTDAWPVKIAKNFLALPDDWRTRFTNSGCLIYSE